MVYAMVIVALLLAVTGCAPDEADDTDTGDTTAPGGTDDDAADDVGAGEGQSFEWNFVGAPAALSGSQQFNWWADEVESRTDGRVQITRSFGEGLVDLPAIAQAVTAGEFELGWWAPTFAPNDFPLWGGHMGIPFITSDGEASQRAWIDLYENNELFQQEFHGQNLELMYIDGTSPGMVVGVRSPVQTTQDFSGMEIRGAGLVARIFPAVGAQPVTMTGPETYEALQRGVIDAYSGLTLEAAVANRVHEVAPHTVDTGVGGYGVAGLIVNRDFFESLPDDVRQVLQDVSRDLMDSGMWLDIETAACDELLDSEDVTFTRLPEDEIEAWAAEVEEPILEAWLEMAEEGGVSREEALEFHEERIQLVRQYEETSTHPDALAECVERFQEAGRTG